MQWQGKDNAKSQSTPWTLVRWGQIGKARVHDKPTTHNDRHTLKRKKGEFFSADIIQKHPHLPLFDPSRTQQAPIHILGVLLQEVVILVMLRVDGEHVPLDLPRIPRYIHQHLPGHDPQSYRPRAYRPRRLHFFDGADDTADDLFRVRGAKGGVGAVDGGLDDRVGVFDRFDEGGVRCGVALGDAQAGVVAQFGRQFGRVAQVGGDVVLLAETCCEGGRADSAWKKALSVLR